MQSFVVIVFVFLSTSIFADITDLGLKSNYPFRNNLEHKLVITLSNHVNKSGQLLSFPRCAVPKDKKLVVGIINYPEEHIYVVENTDDLKKCIKIDDRALYYFIDISCVDTSAPAICLQGTPVLVSNDQS